MKELRGWNLVDERRAVLWREYEFTKGAWATTLVFRGDEGLIAVSPGRGFDSADLDVLRDFGDVRALIANNAYHHLGQRPWRQHFPNAESFAAAAVTEKLTQKSKDFGYRPIDQLPLPEGAAAHTLAGCAAGELFFTVQTSLGGLWYSGDLLTNIQRLPKPPLKWFFTWTGSAPGFKLFNPCVWFFVKDKKAAKKHLTEILRKTPPSIIVPAHGPAFEAPDTAKEAEAQIAKL